MMASQPLKRIVILESDYLLSAGVQSFLAGQERFEVFGIDAKEPEQIYRAIALIQPDVIIMDQNSKIANFETLISQLDNIPTIRTITLNLSDNQIKVCERNNIEIQQLSDFLSVL